MQFQGTEFSELPRWLQISQQSQWGSFTSCSSFYYSEIIQGYNQKWLFLFVSTYLGSPSCQPYFSVSTTFSTILSEQTWSQMLNFPFWISLFSLGPISLHTSFSFLNAFGQLRKWIYSAFLVLCRSIGLNDLFCNFWK